MDAMRAAGREARARLGQGPLTLAVRRRSRLSQTSGRDARPDVVLTARPDADAPGRSVTQECEASPAARARDRRDAIGAGSTRRSTSLLSIVSALWIFAIMALICADIVMRNVFNAPISGVAEFIALSVPACVFLQLAERHRPMAAGPRRTRHRRARGAQPARRGGVQPRLQRWSACSCSGRFWTGPGRDFMQAWTSGEYAGVQGAYEIPVWPFKSGADRRRGLRPAAVREARDPRGPGHPAARGRRGAGAGGQMARAGAAGRPPTCCRAAVYLCGVVAVRAPSCPLGDLRPIHVGIWSIGGACWCW